MTSEFYGEKLMEFLIGEWEVFSLRDFNATIRIECIYLTF